MAETRSRPGRAHDAEGSREAILDAAEKVFAEHGFDGARIDVIAAEAGYNKSLIFQYFGDKFNLYVQVIRRADEQTRGLQTEIVTALRDTDPGPDAAAHYRALFRSFLGGYFDYLIEHPSLMRILLWEMAEGWQTYAKLITQLDTDDVEQIKPMLDKVRDAGLFRSDFEPMAQIVLVEMLFPCFLASIPLCRILGVGEDLSSPTALARAREYFVDFAVHAVMVEPPHNDPNRD
ncbi:MAG: TetR/AcrR family transcriptional regulator [Anaerolineae bacterium]